MSEISLHNLTPSRGSKKPRKRVGRGWASRGKYSGRGMKGQRSRSGGKSGLKKKGLRQIMLNIPKRRGFTSPHPKAEVVNLADLAKAFSDGAVISPQTLAAKNLVSKNPPGGVKILGNGELGFKVTVKDCRVSAAARTKIEAAGGTLA